MKNCSIQIKGGRELTSQNFASLAEERMTVAAGDGKRDLAFKTGGRNLSTSKLRSIYALIMNIYTKVDKPQDYEDHKTDLQYLKVKMAYEAGREDAVKQFLEKTSLMALIDGINDYNQFILYCRYAESLVAYFKFYGGKEK